MEVEPGAGWADAVSKILRMGKNNPDSNRILSKAKREHHGDNSGSEDSEAIEETTLKSKLPLNTKRSKPDVQADALLENELKGFATRGVVHLFNAVKTVNTKADKKKKKKKKKKKMRGKGRINRRR